MRVGTAEKLQVLRSIDTGYVLTNDILLHHNETDRHLSEGEEIDVFLYPDKKGNIAATTTIPTVQMDMYDWAEVIEVIPGLGVFVSIGIAKEILVSLDDLPLLEHVWPIAGDMLFVTLGKDSKGRLLAIPATEGVFAKQWNHAPEDCLNQPIQGRVYHTDREGAAFISDDGYRGFIHHTERKTEPRLGQWVEGRVIKVKEDGTVNVSLRPLKKQSRLEDADTILEHLKEHNGIIPFSDKSDAEDIRDTFGISKAAFKRAIGKLMKEKKVEQRNGNMYLR